MSRDELRSTTTGVSAFPSVRVRLRPSPIVLCGSLRGEPAAPRGARPTKAAAEKPAPTLAARRSRQYRRSLRDRPGRRATSRPPSRSPVRPATFAGGRRRIQDGRPVDPVRPRPSAQARSPPGDPILRDIDVALAKFQAHDAIMVKDRERAHTAGQRAVDGSRSYPRAIRSATRS